MVLPCWNLSKPPQVSQDEIQTPLQGIKSLRGLLSPPLQPHPLNSHHMSFLKFLFQSPVSFYFIAFYISFFLPRMFLSLLSAFLSNIHSSFKALLICHTPQEADSCDYDPSPIFITPRWLVFPPSLISYIQYSFIK